MPASAVPDDVYLLDVREDDEWAAGHAPAAHHLPMSELPARLADFGVYRSRKQETRHLQYAVQLFLKGVLPR